MVRGARRLKARAKLEPDLGDMTSEPPSVSPNVSPPSLDHVINTCLGKDQTHVGNRCDVMLELK